VLFTLIADLDPSPPRSEWPESLRTHCADVTPIPHADFLARQHALAQALHASNASAFVAEPGPSAAYLANLGGATWYLSERPLLLLVSPVVAPDGSVSPQVTILTPAFEATRAKGLDIVAENVRWAEWAEDADPYTAALGALYSTEGAVFVDAMVRHFVVAGLQGATSAPVRSAPPAVRQLRERKSERELEIMKCANEVCGVLLLGSVRCDASCGR
jgi:Xaa-Pro aminopeptidase